MQRKSRVSRQRHIQQKERVKKMAVVKEYRSENCVVRIHDDCFEDEESVKKEA